MPELPEELQEAMEAGILTVDQLRELIRLEARALGMSFHQGVEAARRGTLPDTVIGEDLDTLVRMLPAA